jgi:methylmalonyl-CoA/ethylmalonyl-CoA epimerase
MGLRGVNRIMIAVRDMEQAKRQYGDLLGATFLDANWTGETWGIRVSIAWDAGIELCAPLPGREKDSAVSQFLAHRGEGIMNVFFGVDDGEAAFERASAQGYGCVNSLDYT